MTNYIILALCIVVILSYLFDISAKYSRIPGVILLIGLGIGLQVLSSHSGFSVPNMQPVLPVVGTLGLILIVMDASLDLKLEKNKKGLMIRSVSSALILMVIFTGLFTFILVRFMKYSIITTLLNAIPLGIISSAVAIPSSGGLSAYDKEFIVYESSFSDIFGIMIFDFILLNRNDIGGAVGSYLLGGVLTVVIAVITISALGLLLHKISYHVNYVIIMTAVVLVYILAKLSHLPALLIVLAFGLALSNNRLVEHTFINKFVDFPKFRNDLESFKKIMGEMTFLVRSFFFIMFGYYTSIDGLYNPANLLTAVLITMGIILLRWIFFGAILKIRSLSLILFAPRGLITILLFLSIPATLNIPLINTEVITLVILMTLVIMMAGNMFAGREIMQNTKPETVSSNQNPPDRNADI
jgi:cell volume regulation protein A